MCLCVCLSKEKEERGGKGWMDRVSIGGLIGLLRRHMTALLAMSSLYYTCIVECAYIIIMYARGVLCGFMHVYFA